MRKDLIKLLKTKRCILEHDRDTSNERFHDIMKAAGFSGVAGNTIYYYAYFDSWAATSHLEQAKRAVKPGAPVYTVNDFYKPEEVNNYEIF